MVLPRTSPCDNHECLNGAQCVVMGTDPRCQCLHGYEGEACETLVSVNFVSRESYLQLPSNLLSSETNISLQVQLIVELSSPQLCSVDLLSPLSQCCLQPEQAAVSTEESAKKKKISCSAPDRYSYQLSRQTAKQPHFFLSCISQSNFCLYSTFHTQLKSVCFTVKHCRKFVPYVC